MSGDRWYAAQPVIETATDTTAKCKLHVIDARIAMGGCKCGRITIANRHTATTIIVRRKKTKTAKVVAATQITLKISSTLFSLSFHALAKATFVVCKFLGALGVVNFAAFTGDVRHFRLMPRPPRTAPLSRAQSLLPFVISNLTSSTALICRKIPFCSRSSLFCLVMGEECQLAVRMDVLHLQVRAPSAALAYLSRDKILAVVASLGQDSAEPTRGIRVNNT